jgi:uncharacterized SAM-binding protein YcdF (DUF218 family)
VKTLLVLALAAWIVVAGWLFGVHHDARPVEADAVVVLAGSKTRLPVGVDLVRRHVAPLLVVSRGTGTALEQRVCNGVTGLRVICFVPQPSSTVGEARTIEEIAQRRGLGRIDVVTSEFHVYRARLLIRRCYHGELTMVGAPQPEWKLPWYMATETVKLVYQTTVSRGC